MLNYNNKNNKIYEKHIKNKIKKIFITWTKYSRSNNNEKISSKAKKK